MFLCTRQRHCTSILPLIVHLLCLHCRICMAKNTSTPMIVTDSSTTIPERNSLKFNTPHSCLCVAVCVRASDWQCDCDRVFCMCSDAERLLLVRVQNYYFAQVVNCVEHEEQIYLSLSVGAYISLQMHTFYFMKIRKSVDICGAFCGPFGRHMMNGMANCNRNDCTRVRHTL